MTGPRILSLFSGYGGLDLAVLAVLGGEIVAHAEIEPAACRILEHRFPGVPNIGDVSLVDWSALGAVDVVAGGFPCTDVSSAGKRLGLRPDTRSGLWTQMAYAIGQLRPSLVVIENVRGLLSASAHSDVEPCPWCVGDDGGVLLRALGAVLGDLAGLRYDARWFGVRASDVGAPHGRFRVFIVARPSDADGVELQRRGVGGVLGGSPSAEPGEALQRERAGHPAGDSRAADADSDDAGRSEHRWPVAVPPEQPAAERRGDAAADTGGEALGLRTGLRPGRPGGLRRGRPDDGRAPGTPADAVGLGRDRGTPVEIGEPLGRAAAAGSRRGDRTREAATDAGGDGRRGIAAAHHDDRADAHRDVAHGRAPADPDLDRLARGPVSTAGRQPLRQEDEPDTDRRGGADWGTYSDAVARWEHLTRPAPAPVEPGPKGGQRLSPAFVEWMMGLPAGWVTDVPALTRNEQLKALGNGVVPQQAAHALTVLLADWPALAGDAEGAA